MEIYYLIIFGLGGLWVYLSIKNEGILWIPRAIVNIGSLVLFFYLTSEYYSKIENNILFVLAFAATLIPSVLIALLVNTILDEAIEKRLRKTSSIDEKNKGGLDAIGDIKIGDLLNALNEEEEQK